jgi:hypothetical protein
LEGAYGGSVCDADSDDDGLTDGDEAEDSLDPSDDDSDDDGVSDGLEVERKGFVTAVTAEGLVSVGSDEFQLVEATEFKGLSRDEVAVGVCIEIKGHKPTLESVAVAVKVEEEDNCK